MTYFSFIGAHFSFHFHGFFVLFSPFLFIFVVYIRFVVSTTIFVTSAYRHGEVYSIQLYLTQCLEVGRFYSPEILLSSINKTSLMIP